MTYRDPHEPVGAETPTEAYRAPDAPAWPAAEPASTPPANAPVSPVWPAAEPAPTPAPTSPAAPPPGRRPSRVRWAVAIAVVALVIAVSGVAAVLLTGSAPNAKVLGWVPDDSVVYAEFRLDLPGDQRQNVAEFLSHFPGFDDQAAIDTKLDEAFDQFVSSATDGDQTYTRDIAPWFDGEIAMVARNLPDPAAMENPEAMDAGSAAFLLSVSDAALAQAWLDDATSEAGTTTEDYEGVTITVAPGGESMHDGPLGYAVTGDVAVLGSVGAVKDVLDTNGESAFASDPDFQAALDSAGGDHVAFMYVDMGSYWDWAMNLSAETGAPTTQLAEGFQDTLPAWTALWARVEGDALSFQAVTAPPERRLGTSENHASVLTAHAPATTILYAEAHDYGTAITDMLGLYEDVPVPAETTQQLEQFVGLFGGVDGLVGWIGDVAIVVNDPGEGFEGGLLIQPTDATSAENLFLTLRGMLTLGGASLGVTVSDQEHGDATITTVDFGEVRRLMEQTGESVDPEELALIGGPDAHLQLSWAVTDDLVVIGVGPEFVANVLDTDASTSLASNDRFSSLLARTGADNAGLWYADVAAIRTAIEEAAADKPEAFDRYEREMQPFLEPFDAMVGSTVLGGSEPDTATFLITVK